jgi:hypothetical protein
MENYIKLLSELKADTDTDYKPISAQLAVLCAGAIFSLRSLNVEFENFCIKRETIPDPQNEEAIDKLFNEYLEMLEPYPILMNLALKFIRESRESRENMTKNEDVQD